MNNQKLFLAAKILVVVLIVLFVLSFSKIFVLLAGLIGGYYLATIIRKFKETTLATTTVKAVSWWTKVRAKFNKKA